MAGLLERQDYLMMLMVILMATTNGIPMSLFLTDFPHRLWPDYMKGPLLIMLMVVLMVTTNDIPMSVFLTDFSHAILCGGIT